MEKYKISTNNLGLNFLKISLQLQIVVCLIFLVSYSFGADLHDTPIYMPFKIYEKGSIAEIDINLKRENAVYEFDLAFYFDRKNYKDRNHVSKLVGDISGINIGVETPINLLITRLTPPGEGVIVDYTFKNQRLRSWDANSFRRHIASISLSRGKYRIRVESLKDNPELFSIPIKIGILYPGR